MKERLNYMKVAPEAIKALYAVQRYTEQCGLEHSLLELVKTRASQINGCAYCVDMHTKDARAAGETEQRLYALAVWREAPFTRMPDVRCRTTDRIDPALSLGRSLQRVGPPTSGV